jgi:hypothetical protein
VSNRWPRFPTAPPNGNPRTHTTQVLSAPAPHSTGRCAEHIAVRLR